MKTVTNLGRSMIFCRMSAGSASPGNGGGENPERRTGDPRTQTVTREQSQDNRGNDEVQPGPSSGFPGVNYPGGNYSGVNYPNYYPPDQGRFGPGFNSQTQFSAQSSGYNGNYNSPAYYQSQYQFPAQFPAQFPTQFQPPYQGQQYPMMPPFPGYSMPPPTPSPSPPVERRSSRAPSAAAGGPGFLLLASSEEESEVEDLDEVASQSEEEIPDKEKVGKYKDRIMRVFKILEKEVPQEEVYQSSVDLLGHSDSRKMVFPLAEDLKYHFKTSWNSVMGEDDWEFSDSLAPPLKKRKYSSGPSITKKLGKFYPVSKKEKDLWPLKSLALDSDFGSNVLSKKDAYVKKSKLDMIMDGQGLLISMINQDYLVAQAQKKSIESLGEKIPEGLRAEWDQLVEFTGVRNRTLGHMASASTEVMCSLTVAKREEVLSAAKSLPKRESEVLKFIKPSPHGGRLFSGKISKFVKVKGEESSLKAMSKWADRSDRSFGQSQPSKGSGKGYGKGSGQQGKRKSQNDYDQSFRGSDKRSDRRSSGYGNQGRSRNNNSKFSKGTVAKPQ